MYHTVLFSNLIYIPRHIAFHELKRGTRFFRTWENLIKKSISHTAGPGGLFEIQLAHCYLRRTEVKHQTPLCSPGKIENYKFRGQCCGNVFLYNQCQHLRVKFTLRITVFPNIAQTLHPSIPVLFTLRTAEQRRYPKLGTR